MSFNRTLQFAWGVLVLFAVFSTASRAHEATASFGAPNATAASSLEPIAAVVDAFHVALAKGNRDGALTLLSDKVQSFEQGWVERSRAEYASHHLASDMEFAAAVSSTRTARTGAVAGDVAYVATDSQMKGTFKSKSIDSISLETMMLQRTGSDWRIVHIHWSSRNARE